MGGMKLWKRIMFSVVSIIWGFASLDYLYYAFRLMTGKTRSDGSYDLPRDGAAQLAGVALFLLWFLVVWIFFYHADLHCIAPDQPEIHPNNQKP